MSNHFKVNSITFNKDLNLSRSNDQIFGQIVINCGLTLLKLDQTLGKCLEVWILMQNNRIWWLGELLSSFDCRLTRSKFGQLKIFWPFCLWTHKIGYSNIQKGQILTLA